MAEDEGEDEGEDGGLQAALLYSNVTGNVRAGGRERWSEVWQVSGFDRASMKYPEIWTAEGLPAVGQVLTCENSINPVTGDPMSLYYVDAEPLGLDPENLFNIRFTLQEDPVGLPLHVSKFSIHKTEVAWLDQADNIIANTAGTIFLPGLTRSRAITRLEVIKRFALDDFGGVDIESVVDHVNAAAWGPKWTDAQGDAHTWPAYPAKTVYLDEVRAPQVDEPYPHVQATFMFLIDKKIDNYTGSPTNGQYVGWIKRVPNMGPVFRDSNGKLRAMTDDWDNPTGAPGLLDSGGNKLATGAAPLLLPFELIPSADFGALDLFDN
jgi:hypothetical protein